MADLVVDFQLSKRLPYLSLVAFEFEFVILSVMILSRRRNHLASLYLTDLPRSRALSTFSLH